MRFKRVDPPLVATAVLFTVAYALYGLFRHWHFGSSAYDLGIFDQAVWHLSRFQAPASTVSGFGNILGDHFYPIIAAFAPLYWVVPAPESLIVAQAILFGASIVPVFLFVNDRLPRGTSYAVVVAYGLFWGIQRAMAFDVHEIAFAPLIIATSVVALDRKLWGLLWIMMVLLVLTKEDLVPLVGGFGLYLVMQGDRRRGVTLIVVSTLVFTGVVGFVIPAFNESGGYTYTSAYASLIERPCLIPLTVVDPPIKLQTAFLWLAPFAFMPLASPLSILILPIALERLLSSSPQHWGPAFHYSAPLAPLLAMSAADGLARLGRRFSSPAAAPHMPVQPPRGGGRVMKRPFRRFETTIAAVCVVLSAFLPGRQPLWRIFTPSHYRSTGIHEAGYQAVRLVPDHASVVAQAAIVPHLSQREAIFMLDAGAPDADYIIAAESLSPWPAETFDELENILDARRQNAYEPVFQQNGWIVLRRNQGPRGSMHELPR